MHGYAKIKLVDANKLKSVDFSHLSTSPHAQKLNDHVSENEEKSKKIQTLKAENTNDGHFSSEMDVEDVNEKRVGVKLSRNHSVSSAASNMFRLDRQGSKRAVMGAFSVRRSSSVSERYCRIHDQYVTLASSPLNGDVEDGGNDVMKSRSVKMKKRNGGGGGRILKACKRIFGL